MEQPTRFELVINLKTAKAVAVTVTVHSFPDPSNAPPAAALVRPVAAMALALSRSGTVFTSISSRARASESTRGSAMRRRSFALASGATSIVGKDCLQSRRSARCRGGPWAFDELRDDGSVPVICPACQMVSKGSLKASRLARPGYFAWGCFRYFIRERVSRRPCRWLSR